MSYPKTSYSNIALGGTSHTGYGAVPPQLSGQVYTVSGNNGTSPLWATSASASYNTHVVELGDHRGSGRLTLKGKDADVEINGKSLCEAIQAIEEALLIPGRLNRNTELEREFAELKALGDQYAEMERKYRDQKRVWDILKTED
jgi:hypothetical protein